MKIVYVDTALDGHHLSYLRKLVENNNYESVVIAPDYVESLLCKQITSQPRGKRTLSTHMKWIKEVYQIIVKENPDIVHFLYGDVFYRFFGCGLQYFRKYRVILTLHWTRSGILGWISTWLISKKTNYIVVHTEYIKNYFFQKGIKNVEHIEYPQFNCCKIDSEEAKRYWELRSDVPVIACIGGTRYDKGLDILLDSLQKVCNPFQLLIAGKEEAFDEQYIQGKVKTFADRVITCLKYLDEQELNMALNASDIIVLPYRKVFDGASGPLGEGVWLRKRIVGPRHKSLGNIIETNELGATFECENIDDLSSVLERVLSEEVITGEKYEKYRETLNPSYFVKKYNELYVSGCEKSLSDK